MKKIVLSAILVTSLFSGSVYAAPAKPAQKPAPKPVQKKVVPTENYITLSEHKKLISTIKLYLKISDKYRELADFENALYAVENELTNSYYGIVLLNSTEMLNRASYDLGVAGNRYNLFLNEVKDLKAEATKNGLDISDMDNLILPNYLKALENYKQAYYSLSDYQKYRTQTDFDKYEESWQKGVTPRKDGEKQALDGYYRYYNALQNTQ